MEGRVITAKMFAEFKEHLILEERSVATIQKYIRDVKVFMCAIPVPTNMFPPAIARITTPY